MYPIFALRKLFLIVLSVLLVCLILPASTALAQEANLLKDKQEAINQGSNQEAWLDEAFSSNLTSSIRALMGNIPDSVLKGETGPGGVINYIPGGAIGGTTKLISSLYNQPISGIQYIAQVKDDFLGKPVYAQGVGFRGLQPLLPMWRAFRNIVYILSTILFIIMGLMIILRIKISPQAVVTIQNAVPRIIIVLILVTFSYAIVGLLVDLTNFLQAVFIAILFNATNTDLSGNLFTPNIFGQVHEALAKFFKADTGYNLFDYTRLSNIGFTKYFELVKAAIPTGTLFALGSILGTLFGLIIGVFAGGVSALAGGAIGLLAGGPLLILILQVVIIISLIRFFFGLVRAYITVLIKVITAPIEIGLGAIPNSNIGFSSWFFDVLANLLVFPASVVFIIIVNLIIRNISATDFMWAPSIIGVAGVATFNLIPAIIGLGAVLILPKLPDLIPQVIFNIKPSPFGSAIGQTLAPVSALGYAGGQAVSNIQQERYQTRHTNQSIRTRDRITNTIGDFAGFITKGKIKR